MILKNQTFPWTSPSSDGITHGYRRPLSLNLLLRILKNPKSPSSLRSIQREKSIERLRQYVQARECYRDDFRSAIKHDLDDLRLLKATIDENIVKLRTGSTHFSFSAVSSFFFFCFCCFFIREVLTLQIKNLDKDHLPWSPETRVRILCRQPNRLPFISSPFYLIFSYFLSAIIWYVS